MTMRRASRLTAIAAQVFLLLAATADSAEPRLVSLAPSLTEMVFELDAGTLLTGATNQCLYPPEAKKVPRIGLYQTPSIEAIMAAGVDVILALKEHAPQFPIFDELGLRYEVFDHRSLPGLLDSLVRLGDICGRQEKATELHDRLERELTPPPPGQDSPRLLFVISRDYGIGSIANAYIAGRDDLYDRIIAAAGCRNAYEGDIAYPSLSGEGVAALRPDIIAEAIQEGMGTDLPEKTLRRDWESLSRLPAVRDGKVYYISSDYVFIPGMRLLLLKDELKKLVGGDLQE